MPEVIDSLKQTGIGLSLIVCLIMAGSIFINAFKWQKVLTIHGVNFPFDELSEISFIAMFVNNFLPSNIGGDQLLDLSGFEQ